MNFSPISSEILETSSKYIILDHKLAITKQSYLQIFEFPRSFRSRAKNYFFNYLAKTAIPAKRAGQMLWDFYNPHFKIGTMMVKLWAIWLL